MKTTGIFTALLYRIRFTRPEPFRLNIFSDVHKYSLSHDAAAWSEYLQECRTYRGMRQYYMGVGDYCDPGSTSERIVLKSEKLHESTVNTIIKAHTEQTDTFTEDIRFMAPTLIGLIGGNHDADLFGSVTQTQKICSDLQCAFLGVSALVHLQIFYGAMRRSLKLFVHHGTTGGRTLGGGLNPVQAMQRTVPAARVYIMGHSHQKAIGFTEAVDDRIRKDGSDIELVREKVVYIRTGSFLEGFERDVPCYTTESLYPPTGSGAVALYVTPHRRNFYEAGQKRSSILLNVQAVG